MVKISIKLLEKKIRNDLTDFVIIIRKSIGKLLK